MRFKNLHTIELTDEAGVDFLKQKGVVKVDRFLGGPQSDDYTKPYELDNMEQLIDELHDAFTNNKMFFLQVDPDADGFTSSAIFYNFFKQIYPDAKIEYRLQEGKEHGVIVKTVPVYADVVIIPDAGSNQIEEHEQLVNSGKRVLIMDHHICDSYIDREGLVIVNSQFGDFSNRDLSGAGVTYKTIQAYDEKYLKTNLYKDFEDLAAIGIVGDMMDIRHLDNNAIIFNGMRNVKNPMLKAIIKERAYSISNTDMPTKTDISFYIVPLINAVIRSGTMDEKYEFFEGFISAETDANITTVSRGFERTETLHQHLARLGSNLKSKQDRRKQKSFDELTTLIDSEYDIDNKILITKIGNQNVPKTVTGLIAMELSKYYFKPSLLLRPITENGVLYYRGSGRNIEHEALPSLMHALNDSGLVDYCQGHENAFGVGIKADNIDKLTEWFNEKLKDVELVKENMVDLSVDNTNWNYDGLFSLGSLEPICGRGIPEPLIHFTFEVSPRAISIIGSNSDVIKINYLGVSFIAFKASDIIKKFSGMDFVFGDKVKVEVVGVPSINTWNGNQNVQVKMKDVELTKSVKGGGF